MNLKKSLIVGVSVLALAPVASATFVSAHVSAVENTENIVYQENEYTTNKEKLIEEGYSVDNDRFEYGGLTYTKVFREDGSYGLIEESSNHVTTYLINPEKDGTYTMTAENANGEKNYLRITEDGKILSENLTSFRAANACDWGVGLSGVALSAIYGAAFGTAFGGPAGTIAGAAVGAAWIPVGAACP